MTVRLLVGDARERLRDLPDGSVNCVVTSPPYFGLRDYGTGQWMGGDPDHEHETTPARGGRGGSGAPGKQWPGAMPSRIAVDRCSCGAKRVDHQIGLEKTPEQFIDSLVEVFREVHRVLRDDGTLWLNIGDSYANDSKWGGATGGKASSGLHGQTGVGRGKVKTGLQPKELVGIPWMLAFALRRDGWLIRQEIIWNKANPQPEPVKDRCTSAHEQLFLITKRPHYYFDSTAIQEPAACDRVRGPAEHPDKASTNGNAGLGRRAVTGFRNKRDVWTVQSEPFAEAHFATYPPALIEDCIKAGCPEGGVVLDPFGGSGTTAMVADRLKRNAILVELNPDFAKLAERRLIRDGGLFMRVEVE